MRQKPIKTNRQKKKKSKNKRVTDVELGWNVEHLDEKAFYKMEALETAKLPVTFKGFNGHANFYHCTSLKEVILPDALEGLEPRETYHEGNFEGCTNLVSIHLPESLKFIGDRCFYGCLNLKTVNFPGPLEDIQSHAFAECVKLDRVDLGNNLLKIQSHAFLNASNIRLDRTPKNVIEIGNYAFFGTGLRVLYLLPENPPTIFEDSLPNLERVFVRQGYSTTYYGTAWSRFTIVEEYM